MCLVALHISVQAEPLDIYWEQSDAVSGDIEGEGLYLQLEATTNNECLEKLSEKSTALEVIFQAANSPSGFGFLKHGGSVGVLKHKKAIIEWNRYMNSELFSNVQHVTDLDVDVVFSKKNLVVDLYSNELQARFNETDCLTVTLESYGSLKICCLSNTDNEKKTELYQKDLELLQGGKRTNPMSLQVVGDWGQPTR